MLDQSYVAFVAIEENRIVGFINAISDGILSAYIPLIEVTDRLKGNGIGSKLMQVMLSELEDFYMIDLCCDDGLVQFYERFSMRRTTGMAVRNHLKQNGA